MDEILKIVISLKNLNFETSNLLDALSSGLEEHTRLEARGEELPLEANVTRICRWRCPYCDTVNLTTDDLHDEDHAHCDKCSAETKIRVG